MPGLQDLATALNNIAQNLGRLIAQTSLAVLVPITQGGTGATTASGARANLGIVVGAPGANHAAVFASANSIEDGGLIGSLMVGELLTANFNSTADQVIAINYPPGAVGFLVDAIVASNPSISMTTAAGGIYLGSGKTGFQLVPASQSYSGLTNATPNVSGSALVLSASPAAMLNAAAVYFSLTTPQGVAATADLRIYGRPMF
jgi:hypothetical protein